jgi:hypothetical protein
MTDEPHDPPSVSRERTKPVLPDPPSPSRELDQLHREPLPRSWPRPAPFRPILLWVLSAPLVPAAVAALAAGHLPGFIGDALGWGLVAAAAVLTRRGFAGGLSGEPGERRFSRRWRLPLRNLAAAALGLGTCVVAVLGSGHLLSVGLAFGAVAVLGYHLAYGLEPLRLPTPTSALDKESRAVATAIRSCNCASVGSPIRAAASWSRSPRGRRTCAGHAAS